MRTPQLPVRIEFSCRCGYYLMLPLGDLGVGMLQHWNANSGNEQWNHDEWKGQVR